MSPVAGAGNDLVAAMTRFCAHQSEGNAQPAVQEMKNKLEQQVQQNEEVIAQLQKQVNELVHTQAAQEQVAASRIQTLDNRVADLSNKHWTLGQSVEKVQASVKEGAEKVQAVEVASQAFSKQLEGIQQVAEITSQECRQQLADTALLSDLQALRNVVTGVGANVASVQEAVHEKVGTAQIQQLLHVVEGVEKELQKLSETVIDNQRKVTDVNRALQDKAECVEVQQLNKSLDGIDKACSGLQAQLGTQQSKLPSLERDVHELKATIAQQIEHAVKGVQQHVLHVEQSLHDKVEINQIQQLATSVSNIDTKLIDISHVVHDKVGLSQIQGVNNMVTNVENKLSLLELAVEMKADRAYVDTEIQGKAGEMYVNADFDKKRLKAYVDGEMQKKADHSYVRAELENRPVKEEVANAVMSVLNHGTPSISPRQTYR